uniref:Uncharacterized protein n=1 Tax=Globisporangium ultimum (strain ATCC 200006 / CBS 805.95 / DAOM BR144) TaxID=431595 RepID=K3WUF9_GLOUD
MDNEIPGTTYLATLGELSTLLQTLDAPSSSLALFDSSWPLEGEVELLSPGGANKNEAPAYEVEPPQRAGNCASPTALTLYNDSTDQLVEDGEQDIPPTVEMDASIVAGKQARQAAMAARRRDVHREKKRNELHQLRAESAVLAVQLDKLLAKNEILRSKLQYRADDCRAIAGWKRIALRQMKRRLDSEALNRELRAQIRMHQALTQDLMNVLRTRLSTIDSNGAMALVSPLQNTIIEFNDADLRLISSFTSEMDSMYEQTDDVFRSRDIASVAESTYSLQYHHRWDEQTKSQYVEVLESTVVSFGLHETVQGLLKSLLLMFGKECTPAVISLPPSKNTSALKVTFTFGAPDGESSRYQYVGVVKRFDERDRNVFVWRAFTENIDDGSVRAQFIESGWCVAQEQSKLASSGPTMAGSTPTVLRYCTRIRPLQSRAAFAVISAMRPRYDYIDMLIQSGENEARTFVQTIEDVLMDDAVSMEARI